MNKKLTFLLAFFLSHTFLYLCGGSVYVEEPVDKEYWDNGKLKWKTYYEVFLVNRYAK
jgi:hypothetical protein